MTVSLDWLVGLKSDGVLYRADNDEWVFGFGDHVQLTVTCPWRIIGSKHIALGHDDHRQKFGLSEPVDGERRAGSLISGRKVVAAHLEEETADVTLEFKKGVRLEVFNNSSGYEGWALHGPDRRMVVGLGGGSVAEWGPTQA